MKDKVKAHMSKHHRLGDANTDSGYYNYWMRLHAKCTSYNWQCILEQCKNKCITEKEWHEIQIGHFLYLFIGEIGPPLWQSH